MLVLVLIFGLLMAMALVHGYVESFRTGPSHCMGCGKCDHNGGVCVLTDDIFGKGKRLRREKVPR